MKKYYLAIGKHTHKPFEGVEFEPMGYINGALRGVFATDDENYQLLLDGLVQDPKSGINEIEASTYERLVKKKSEEEGLASKPRVIGAKTMLPQSKELTTPAVHVVNPTPPKQQEAPPATVEGFAARVKVDVVDTGEEPVAPESDGGAAKTRKQRRALGHSAAES